MSLVTLSGEFSCSIASFRTHDPRAILTKPGESPKKRDKNGMEPCWEWEEESKVNRGVNVTSVYYIDA